MNQQVTSCSQKNKSKLYAAILFILAIALVGVGIAFYFRNHCFRHDISIPIGWFVVSIIVFAIGVFVLCKQIKPFLKFLGCYTVILALGVGFMYAFGGSDEEFYNYVNSDRVESITEQEGQDAVSNTNKEELSEEQRLQRWTYADETDPMTDNISHSAKIYSLEKKIVNGVETPLAIFIQRESGGAEPIVLMGMSDERCKFRSRLPLLYYRINDGQEQHQSYMATADNIIYIGGNDWIEKLKNANKLAVKIELADGSTETFTFNTAGFRWK